MYDHEAKAYTTHPLQLLEELCRLGNDTSIVCLNKPIFLHTPTSNNTTTASSATGATATTIAPGGATNNSGTSSDNEDDDDEDVPQAAVNVSSTSLSVPATPASKQAVYVPWLPLNNI